MPNPCCSLAPLVNLVNGMVSPFIQEAYAPYSYEAQQQKLNQLKEKEEEVKDKLDKLEKQDTGVAVLNKDAVNWKNKVHNWLQEVEQQQSNLERSIEATCASGCLPNCHQRRAAKKLLQKHCKEVDELLKCCMLPVKGHLKSQNDTVQKTRSEEIRKIWEYLTRRDEVKVVCIHGVALVGKTTIAEAICNKALLDEHETFGYTIWVDAGFECQLKSLQEKIMKTLNIDTIDTDDDYDRALKICDEFVRRKKCLVIIDFLWENFTLRDVGIPENVGVEGTVCKVILTSRSRLTCPRIQKDKYVEIKTLSEGWNFFKEVTDKSFESLEGEAEDLVKKAVEICEGSPSEIKRLASSIRDSMHGHSSRDIVQTLKEFTSSQTIYEPSIESDIFNILECSYKSLNDNCQKCFMYCALYPKVHPIEVEGLIDSWMWEGLLDDCLGALEHKRERGRKVLIALKNARLLEKEDSNGAKDRVKMLSLIHNMAMNINYWQKSKDYIDSGNDLVDFPIDDQYGEIRRASFMYNKLGALRNQPNCPNLTTLLLQNNPLELISDKFFPKIPKLKILNLSYTKIFNIPSSICHLKFLQVLQLRHCLNLRSLPCLSTLLELVVLDLFGTPLEELPLGMENLKNLKRLDLSHTKLTKFQNGLVSALESLQEFLFLIDNAEAYSWRSRESRSAEAYVEELACLDGLRILQLNFYNKAAFDNYVKAIPSTAPRPKAPRFKFCVGGFITYGNLGDNSIAFIDGYPDDNQLLPDGMIELHLSMCRRSLTQNKTIQKSGIIFEKLKVLHLSSCSGLTYLFSFEMLHCLQNLEKISARDCWSILGIIEPKSNSSIDPKSVSSCCLPRLQELVLVDLPKLESLCPGQSILEWPAFRTFSIWNCDNLLLKSLPFIVKKVLENPKKIKLRGNNFKLDLDDLNRFELEEAAIPEEIVTFSSTKKSESTKEPMANDDRGSFFKRKATERTRTAAILSENERDATPPRSPGYIVRRLDAATGLLRSLQRRIGVLFIE